MNELRVGIIGFGFMGRTHLRAWRAAAESGRAVRVTRICDRTGAAGGPRAPGNLEAPNASEPDDLSEVSLDDDAGALLADPGIDIVSICTPTETHVPLALNALAAGKHVLVEKPLALRAAECAPLVAAAARSDRFCLPALCMRFWPAWAWLRARVASGQFGPVHSATFARLGTRPAWSTFYADAARSGGALVDLHIHDADFVRWCFGEPTDLSVVGRPDHFTTAYHFAAGPPHVTAEASWRQAPGTPFTMRYRVNFEHATADFDISRPLEQQLLLAHADAWQPVALEPLTGYDVQARQLLDAIAGRRRVLDADAADAAATAALLDRERAALEQRPAPAPGARPAPPR